MYYLAFAIFFALNFSLWFIIPSFTLRYIIRPGRKRKDANLNNELFIYGFLTALYILIYILFYRYFSIAINDLGTVETGTIGYFTTEISNLSLMTILFFAVSVFQCVFTFYLAKKLFKLKKVNIGYVICSLTGFFNIITYWFSNSILKLNLYSFDMDKIFLNSILKIDYELLLFLFPVMVFVTFAFSFLEESN